MRRASDWSSRWPTQDRCGHLRFHPIVSIDFSQRFRTAAPRVRRSSAIDARVRVHAGDRAAKAPATRVACRCLRVTGSSPRHPAAPRPPPSSEVSRHRSSSENIHMSSPGTRATGWLRYPCYGRGGVWSIDNPPPFGFEKSAATYRPEGSSTSWNVLQCSPKRQPRSWARSFAQLATLLEAFTGSGAPPADPCG